jgi:hypothetical protein
MGLLRNDSPRKFQRAHITVCSGQLLAIDERPHFGARSALASQRPFRVPFKLSIAFSEEALEGEEVADCRTFAFGVFWLSACAQSAGLGVALLAESVTICKRHGWLLEQLGL